MVLIFLDFGVFKCSSTHPKNNNREHKEQQWFPLHLGHIWTPIQHKKTTLKTSQHICVKGYFNATIGDALVY